MWFHAVLERNTMIMWHHTNKKTCSVIKMKNYSSQYLLMEPNLEICCNSWEELFSTKHHKQLWFNMIICVVKVCQNEEDFKHNFVIFCHYFKKMWIKSPSEESEKEEFIHKNYLKFWETTKMGNKHGKRRREPSVTSSQPGKPKVRLVSPKSHRRHLRETSRQRHGTAREASIYDVT